MDTLVDKEVTTRKEHHCFGCARKFKKGSKLRYCKVIDGGVFDSAYWCPVCLKYWEKYMGYSDEIGYGELKSEDYKGWEEIRKEVEG